MTQDNYKYSLNSKVGKGTCPKCGRKGKFVFYVDNSTGEILNELVGRCDREYSCSYHYTPKQFFEDNNFNACKPLKNPIFTGQNYTQKGQGAVGEKQAIIGTKQSSMKLESSSALTKQSSTPIEQSSISSSTLRTSKPITTQNQKQVTTIDNQSFTTVTSGTTLSKPCNISDKQVFKYYYTGKTPLKNSYFPYNQPFTTVTLFLLLFLSG